MERLVDGWRDRWRDESSDGWMVGKNMWKMDREMS